MLTTLNVPEAVAGNQFAEVEGRRLKVALHHTALDKADSASSPALSNRCVVEMLPIVLLGGVVNFTYFFLLTRPTFSYTTKSWRKLAVGSTAPQCLQSQSNLLVLLMKHHIRTGL